MMDMRHLLIKAACVLAVILLQVMLAPAMTIGSAVPNFILAFVIGRSLVHPDEGVVLPFVLGLLYDLIGNGPIGGMAFACVAVAYLGSRLLFMLDNDTFFIPLVLIVVEAFLANLIYGILVIVCGLDVSVMEALLTRALPCGLYDAVLGLLMFAALTALTRVTADPMRLR